MVTANLDSLSSAFEDIVEERDVVSIGSIGLAGAGGGVIATQLAGRVAPIVGLESSPSDLTGLLANGTIKMAVGAALAFGAVQLGGMPGVVLGIAGLGALVLGGGDWINAVLATDVGVPSSATRGRSSSGNRTARVVSSSQTRNSRNNDVKFRATTAGQSTGHRDYDHETTFR